MQGSPVRRSLLRGRRWLVVRLAVFVLLAAVATTAVLASIDSPEVAEVAPYFMIAIALQLLPLLVRREPDPFEPAVLSSFLNILVLVPALVSYAAAGTLKIELLPQLTGRTRTELIQSVVIVYIVSSFIYQMGYYSRLHRHVAGAFPRLQGWDWDEKRLWIGVLVCAAFFVPAYAYFQGKIDAPLTDITALGKGKAVWREDPEANSWLLRAIAFGFLPPLLLLAHNLDRRRLQRAIGAFVASLVVAFLVTRTGQRGPAVYGTLNLMMVFHYMRRRIPIVALAAFVFGVLAIGNVLGAYRLGTHDSAAPGQPWAIQQTLVQHEADRERVAVMAVILYYFPDRQDYLMGETWAGLGVAFVPRWIWPEKLELMQWRDTIIINRLVEAPFPTPFVGALYCNFSWIGVVLGMFLWGVFHRGLYEWLRTQSNDKSVVLIYSCVAIRFAPIYLSFSDTIQYLLPLYLLIRFARKGRRPALPAAPP